MKRLSITFCVVSSAAATLLLLAARPALGQDFRWPWQKKPDPKRDADFGPVKSKDRSLPGTVRAAGYVEGMRKIRVRGYGIVGNLANTGGSDCPDVVRKHLESEIRRRKSADGLDLEPAEILSNKGFAAVQVTGEIPAAAQKGERFDLFVQALGNQTTSLDDGMLYFCDLRLYQNSPRGVVEGKTLADAQGALYVSPFGQSDNAATKADPRAARVFGGGIVRDDRRLRVILNTPSYSVASRIRDRLNGRFGGTTGVADATTPNTVQLNIPREYVGDARRFIDLVLHSPILGDPGELMNRAAELVEDIGHPDAQLEDIAMTWEAIGETVIPAIRRAYSSQVESAAYYAARAGLRLGDEEALDVISHHATSPRSPFREQAIAELGHATKLHRAADRLRPLLSDPDNQTRILAYEALVQRGDRSIRSTIVWTRDNLILDLVDTDAEPLIYARQAEQARLAIFGRNLSMETPVLYSNERRQIVTINAPPGAKVAHVVRRNVLHDRLSDPMPAPLEVAGLVAFLADRPVMRDGNMRGLGLSYSVIVDALNKLTESNSIPAVMVFERPRLSEKSYREVKRDRAESEF